MLNFVTDRRNLISEISALKTRNDALLLTTQALINAQTGLDENNSAHYTGSQYRTYDAQVSELARKYSCTADWGSLVMKNIIDVRAAFIAGTGVIPRVRDGFKGDAKREIEFIQRLCRMNDVKGKKPQLWGTEAEIEGKVLFKLKPIFDPLDGMGNIKVVHVPWRKFRYNIQVVEPDFEQYVRATYTGTSLETSFDLASEGFVYARFGGNSYEVNLTPPKAAFVLRHTEDLDKELWDWRKINHLFAAPTPWFNCEDVDEARRLTDYISAKNWRIGKAIVTSNSEFDLVCAKGEGFNSIKQAIESDIQVISGTTGVPVHFLGHPELLSNRSTADTLLQLIELSTDKERDIWQAAYTELFRKATLMFNSSFNNNLNPDAIIAEMPVTSTANLVFVEKVYLPMYLQGALSLQTLLSYLTDVDTQAEMERIAAEKVEKQQEQALEMEQQIKLQQALPGGKGNVGAAGKQG